MSDYAAFYTKMRMKHPGDNERMLFPKTVVTEAILARLFTEVDYRRTIAVRSQRQSLRTTTALAYIASRLLKKRDTNPFNVLILTPNKAGARGEIRKIKDLIILAVGPKKEARETALRDVDDYVYISTVKDMKTSRGTMRRLKPDLLFDLVVCMDYEFFPDEDVIFISENVFDKLSKNGVLLFESAENEKFNLSDFKAIFRQKKFHLDYVDLK